MKKIQDLQKGETYWFGDVIPPSKSGLLHYSADYSRPQEFTIGEIKSSNYVELLYDYCGAKRTKYIYISRYYMAESEIELPFFETKEECLAYVRERLKIYEAKVDQAVNTLREKILKNKK